MYLYLYLFIYLIIHFSYGQSVTKVGNLVSRYGILGKTFKSIFGHIGGATLGPILSGLVGLKEANDHGVPYSLTEEFTSVYRMHSLLPDTLQVRNINAPPSPNKAPSLLKEYLSLPPYPSLSVDISLSPSCLFPIYLTLFSPFFESFLLPLMFISLSLPLSNVPLSLL